MRTKARPRAHGGMLTRLPWLTTVARTARRLGAAPAHVPDVAASSPSSRSLQRPGITTPTFLRSPRPPSAVFPVHPARRARPAALAWRTLVGSLARDRRAFVDQRGRLPQADRRQEEIAVARIPYEVPAGDALPARPTRSRGSTSSLRGRHVDRRRLLLKPICATEAIRLERPSAHCCHPRRRPEAAVCWR